MGARKRKSSDRLRLRVQLPNNDRDTLLPCPACEGDLSILIEFPDGRYLAKRCRWCDGTGHVDTAMHRMFQRWLRIYNINVKR